MEDAVKATLDIMNANPDDLTIRSSYNLSAISFTPEALYDSIKKQIEQFTINYTPDFRQAIADSWPNSIDDSQARNDWNWQHEFALEKMVEEMIGQLQKNRTAS